VATDFNLLNVPAVIKKGDPWKTVLEGQDLNKILESIREDNYYVFHCIR
jgi:uncharacterized protein YqgV (UPF0045/DUF77 family)